MAQVQLRLRCVRGAEFAAETETLVRGAAGEIRRHLSDSFVQTASAVE
jgi:hypothetical protein